MNALYKQPCNARLFFCLFREKDIYRIIFICFLQILVSMCKKAGFCLWIVQIVAEAMQKIAGKDIPVDKGK